MSRRAAAAAAALAAGAMLVAPPVPALAAGIAKVQAGSVATSVAGSTVTPSLPAASTAGNLLVATLASSSGGTAFTGPAGWSKASAIGATGTRSEVWYLANNAGGITSAVFTASGAVGVDGQLSEWSGVAATSALDQTGTGSGTATAQLTVTSGGSTATSGELAIATFNESLLIGALVTFTPGSGWTNLGSSTGLVTVRASTSDYQLGVPVGSVSETETSNSTGAWSGALATFRPIPCSGGSLTLSSPATAGVSETLNGQDNPVTTTLVFTATDQTGSGSGWNVAGTSTLFSGPGGSTLPASATAVTAASAAADAANCSLPSNAITYPTTLPAGATSPAAVRLYDAAAGTGAGPTDVTLTFRVTVPAGARSGVYSSTWTFSMASGP